MNPKTLLVTAAAMFAAVAVMPAFAQADFPSKPVRLVVPFPPGGATDVLGRIAARRLGDLWGKSVVVENKPRASGHVGAAEVARAAPDGYTLVAGTIGIHAAHKMYKKLSYTPSTDQQVITILAEQANLLIVHPAVPAKSVAELVALAKAEPGKLNYASAGPGSSIQADLIRAVAPPEIADELRAQDIGLVVNTPAEAAKFFAAETGKWNRVIDAAKIELQ